MSVTGMSSKINESGFPTVVTHLKCKIAVRIADGRISARQWLGRIPRHDFDNIDFGGSPSLVWMHAEMIFGITG
jgi:hypothetical protein